LCKPTQRGKRICEHALSEVNEGLANRPEIFWWSVAFKQSRADVAWFWRSGHLMHSLDIDMSSQNSNQHVIIESSLLYILESLSHFHDYEIA